MPGPLYTFGMPDIGMKLFRFGESAVWQQTVYAPGQAVKRQNFDFEMPVGLTADVPFINWEIFTENNEDLTEMLWAGSLRWVFEGTPADIGPISTHTGIPTLPPGDDGKGDDPEAVKFVNGLAAQEWRDLVQTFRMGQGYFFRGQKTYTKYHMTLPAKARVTIQTHFDPEFRPTGRVRYRMILGTVFRNVIPIG